MSTHTRLLASLRLTLACVGATLAGNCWSYGWLGHWRVLESQWPVLAAEVCPGKVTSLVSRKLDDKDFYMAAVGAIISDIGYVGIPGFPERFSDLVHYMGSGSFTDNLTKVICEEHGHDPRMLAFAAGLRSHYWADLIGHYEGTNRAVPLVTARSIPGMARLAYEDDKETHKKLEMGTFSAYDLSNGELDFAAAYVANVGAELEAKVVAQNGPLVKALELTYGKPAVRLAPTFVQLLYYTYFVREAVCEAGERTYSDGPKRPEIVKLNNQCKIAQATRRAPPQAAEPSTSALIRDGYKLRGNNALEKIYEQSIRAVESRLAQGKSRPLSNYNFDTNLPSASGQYRQADLVYRELLGSPPKAQCDEAILKEMAGQGAIVDWRKYQQGGACVHYLREPVSSASCPALSKDATIGFIASGWLRDIRPARWNDTMNQCETRKLQFMGNEFQLDGACWLRSDKPLARVHFLYACGAVTAASKGAKPDYRPGEAAGHEALRRLRAEERIDAETGLYP